MVSASGLAVGWASAAKDTAASRSSGSDLPAASDWNTAPFAAVDTLIYRHLESMPAAAAQPPLEDVEDALF